MSCKPVCKLCNHLVLSQAVAFTGGNLEINLPAGSYNNGEKYCIVIAQSIPDTTTINAPVYFTIGTGTTLYDKTELCAGDGLWDPYPHQIFDLCGDNCNRWVFPHAWESLLFPQQRAFQH